MINLFRRIRKNLLRENRISRYLIYALGEILLVMIGILLAFQVGQWNNNNENRKLEKDLLREVEISLAKDLKDVNENFKRNEKLILCQTAILNWIDSGKEFVDTLSPYLSGSFASTYFAAYQGPYETLKQMGMRNITNDSLRNQISKLYNITYPRYLKFNENQEGMLYDQLLPLSYKYINELTFSEPMLVLQPSELRADNEFIALFKTTQNISELLKYIMLATKKEIQNTLSMIEKELQKE